MSEKVGDVSISGLVCSDIDSVTVSYCQGIVKDVQNAACLRADAASPEDILQSQEVMEPITGREATAIGDGGIAWFLPDERIAHAFDVLQERAGSGIRPFVSVSLTREAVDESDKLTDLYGRLNQPIFLRPEERVRELFGRWRIREPGIQHLGKGIELDPSFKQRGVPAAGATLVGTILAKE